MATIRIQLSANELASIESALSPRVSDTSDVKLLIKIQRALVSAGGKISNNSTRVSNIGIRGSSMTVDSILAKMVSDEPITDEERNFYKQQTGQEI